MIAEETINQVKDVPIEDIVSETVALKNAGGNLVGLCPFHNEKTPSFNINTARNYYHCFGCGVSGNVITFVMETQGLSFPEAVEYIANRSNITVKYTEQKRKSDISSSDIYKLNALAYEFFLNNFKSSSEVKIYLKQRKINTDSIETFNVGFAVSEWDALYKFILSRKIPEKLIFASGLVKKNTAGKVYDTFRARVVFPIWIDKSRIAGFGGRIIEADPEKTQAKYLNSPETLAYQKSKILYGYPQALPAIKASKNVYIVEGYLDVIALYQVGVQNVVATCGTALTVDHVKKLNQVCNKITLLFDGDQAGQKAAAKSFEQMLNFDAEIEVKFLPEDSDPDDFAKQYEDKTESQLAELETASLLECYLKSELKAYGVEDISELGAVNKSKLAEKILSFIAKIENSIVRSEQIKQASFLLLISEDELNALAKGQTAIPSRDLEKVDNLNNNKPKEIDQLDYLNRNVLQAVISQKESLPAEVIANANLCQFLDAQTISFITELNAIMGDAQSDQKSKKEKCIQLLTGFPSSWKDFWVQSLKRLEDPLVKPDQMYEQCLQEVEKRLLVMQIKELEKKLAALNDQEVKMKVMQDKLELDRALKSMG